MIKCGRSYSNCLGCHNKCLTCYKKMCIHGLVPTTRLSTIWLQQLSQLLGCELAAALWPTLLVADHPEFNCTFEATKEVTS